LHTSNKYTNIAWIDDYVESNDIPKNTVFIEEEHESEKLKIYPTLSVSTNFLKMNKISLMSGNDFQQDWQYHKGESTPVILGYDYHKYLHLGDIFTDKNSPITYKVIGFLAKDASYVDISIGEGVIKLNNVMLSPIDVTTFDSMFVDGNCNYESYFDSLTILVKNQGDIVPLQKITQPSREYHYIFKNMKDISNYMAKDTKESVEIFLYIATFTIIFSFMLIIINTLEFIRKNKREFSIHIFCGATKIDIAYRIFLQIFVVCLLATLIAMMLVNKLLIVLSVSLCIFFLCLIVCIPSFVMLFRLQVSDMLRRKE